MAPHRTSTDLSASRRLVVKIGSALLVDEARGTVHRQWLDGLADDLARCRARGQEVLIVSSGAVAVGRRVLNLTRRDLSLPQKQAAAAAGMVRLVHAYQDSLNRHGLPVGQVLLTLDDTENRRRYLNARNTLDTLVAEGAVPLINENDTVATDEIRVGDNDRLAARVAAMASADTLVLLSDIDGLYSADPRHDPDASFIPVVRTLTPEILGMAGSPGSSHGSGGMVTKLAAARICLAAGCRMVITRGSGERPLSALEDGARASWFLPEANPATARKAWISGGLKPEGKVTADAGAVRALLSGRSLLAAGVSAVDGNFEKGALVVVGDDHGREIARGLIAYSAVDARQIIGHKTGDMEAILGYRGRDELIHRDDLVLAADVHPANGKPGLGDEEATGNGIAAGRPSS